MADNAGPDRAPSAPTCRESLIRCTPYTIVQPGRLAGDLTAVRRRGWASTREETTLGSCSIAVPVLAGTSDDAGGWPAGPNRLGRTGERGVRRCGRLRKTGQPPAAE